MLAGGAEAPLTFGVLRAREALRTLALEDTQDPSASCRPFSRSRNGLVLGEGAAFAVLEEWEHAIARGVPIHAKLSGYGLSCDASHITRPTVEGQARAMRAALDDVFGERAYHVPVSSTKSVHGHLLGAAGALEFVIAVICLVRGVVPPTMHLDVPDAECDLDYVSGCARTGVNLRAVMSNSMRLSSH